MRPIMMKYDKASRQEDNMLNLLVQDLVFVTLIMASLNITH